MPESVAAAALEPTTDRQCPAEYPSPSRPKPAGRLQETFDNELVLSYLDLAEALARRFEARGRERADLNQVAYLGLVKAARGFDPAKGGSFPAYAAPTITGELKRYLRDRTWVVRPPRSIQDLRTRMFRVEPELTQDLGRTPSVAELAAELQVDPAEVREAISAGSSLHPDSLDAVNPGTDTPCIGDVLPCQDSPLERLEELACLRGAIQGLADADRDLLYRRYFCEETQAELGKRLGMSQMQVSRRLARVLVELQGRLEEAASGRGTLPAADRAGRECFPGPGDPGPVG